MPELLMKINPCHLVGGSVAVEDRPKKPKQQNYPLYFLQSDMRERIDAARRRAGGVKPPSVNEWINEAILDKLRAEE
jgi:hypothetical protein